MMMLYTTISSLHVRHKYQQRTRQTEQLVERQIGTGRSPLLCCSDIYGIWSVYVKEKVAHKQCSAGATCLYRRVTGLHKEYTRYVAVSHTLSYTAVVRQYDMLRTIDACDFIIGEAYWRMVR